MVVVVGVETGLLVVTAPPALILLVADSLLVAVVEVFAVSDLMKTMVVIFFVLVLTLETVVNFAVLKFLQKDVSQ